MPVLTIGIVRDCFYRLKFYSEKFSTWVWRVPFAVNVHLNLSTDDVSQHWVLLLIGPTGRKMYFYKQSEALPRSAIFEKNVEKNRRYHVYSFKIKLLKALKTTTTPPPPPKKTMLKSAWFCAHSTCSNFFAKQTWKQRVRQLLVLGRRFWSTHLVAGWIPGTGLNLSVLKQTEKWKHRMSGWGDMQKCYYSCCNYLL